MSRRVPCAARARGALAPVVVLIVAAALMLPTWAVGEQTTLVDPPFGHCLGVSRATSVHLFLYLGTQTHFDEPSGLAAVKLRSRDDPDTPGDDDELTVFGLNSGRCEIIYNTSLTSVKLFGTCGSGDGQFDHPLGIAADEWGGVVVTDTGNDRIVRLRYVNDALRFIETIEVTGAAPSGLSSPSQVALGASGTIYVTDTGNGRILALDQSGKVLLELTGDASAGVRLESPVGLAVVEDDDPWLNKHAGRIVVADRGGTRLLSFDLEGVLRNATEAGEGTAENSRFDYLAIDYHGSVYATDTRSSRVHKFDRHLGHITSVGQYGTGPGWLDGPRGIAIWRRFGQVFVAEREGAQYFWMGTEIRDLTVSPDSFRPGADPLRVTYDLTEVSRVSIVIRDAAGTTVHTMVDMRRRSIGPNAERWDGLLANDRSLPPGEYTLVVTARPVYSARAYFHDIAEFPFVAVR